MWCGFSFRVGAGGSWGGGGEIVMGVGEGEGGVQLLSRIGGRNFSRNSTMLT